MLGLKVKDKITGFSGTVVGHVTYISGCNQVLIVPPVDKDGKLQTSEWFDEQRMEILSDDRIILENGNTPGFDRAPPKR